MPMDFTVIQAVRQRFGDRNFEYDEFPLEQEAPFAGLKEEYQFACPGINPRETGVLQFESLGVTAGRRYVFAPAFSGKRNILRINGVDIPGGITPGAYRSDVGYIWHFWKAHTLLVPANILDENNVLYIESIRIQLLAERRSTIS